METNSGKILKKSWEADDRISKLPDDILLHILSFVTTFDFVATLILSKRWNHLCKHVAKLDFDDTLLPLDCTKYSKNVRFAHFVNKVLTLHVSKVLEKLSLHCGNIDLYDIGYWITISITRNIHSLDLTIYNVSAPHVRLLPSSLFTCKKLEVLVLKGYYNNIIVNVPPVVCLPKLKTMELVGLMYQDDQQGNLISSCVSLESLVVNYIRTLNDYMGFHTISSSTLRDVEFLGWQPSLVGYNPEIFCSALRRLNLSNTSLHPNPIRVPGNVFTCKTLEKLILSGRFVICASKTICLPKLTFLSLVRVVFGDDRVEFGDDENFSKLISSCTSLESLVVSKTMEAELNITSSTLKVIDIKLYCESKPGHKAVINAPALKCLHLSNKGYVDYQIDDLASLEQAHVSWQVTYDYYCSSALTKAYQALRHVKKLSICHHCSSFGLMEYVLPMFNKLTDLAITINGLMMGYGFFQGLIKNSPKLENLSLELNVLVRHDHYLTNDLNTVPVPACLLSSLRCVPIRCFAGTIYELAVASYLLENSRMMEKMEVCFCRDYDIPEERRIELRNKIWNVRRGSDTCNVVVIE